VSFLTLYLSITTSVLTLWFFQAGYSRWRNRKIKAAIDNLKTALQILSTHEDDTTKVPPTGPPN